jgi:nucleoside-diphosphate-sugar epimerase
MKKVLITGAAGAFGRVVVAHINAQGGFQIVSLVKDSIEGMPGEIVHCDLRNSEQISDVLESVRPDLILHLAATFTGSLEETYRANVEPARHILDLVERDGLKSRVVLIGSAAEYGVVQPEENPISEDHVLFPVSVYGVSKAWQTQLVGLYAGRGIDVLCARIFNLFGPGVSDRLFAGRLLRQIQEVLAERKSVIEVGSLTAVRDYVSMDEAVHQLIDITNYGAKGEVYHVGSGVPISMYEFLRLQLECHGLDQSIVRVSPDFSNRHGYDVPVIYANMQKTKALGI